MNLFDAVLASLNDSSRETQLGDLKNLSSAFGGSSAGQVAGLIGGFLKPVLQQQQQVAGQQGVNDLLQELKQNADSPDQLNQVLGADRMSQMVQHAERRTGLDTNAILRLLPVVLPAVIGLLQSGRSTAAPPSAASPESQGAATQTNPILSQFLDSDRDGDVDMADLVRLTSVFLKK